jgi:beta-lactamase class A
MNDSAMNDGGTVTRCAHRLTDLDGLVLAEHDPHRAFYAASTIKLHVLLAALGWEAGAGRDSGTGWQEAGNGPTPVRPALDRAATVPATRTFSGADGHRFTLHGDHLDPTHPADGTPITVGELLMRMIDRSSNEATDTIITLLGSVQEKAKGPTHGDGGSGGDGDGSGAPGAGLRTVGRVISAMGLAGTRVERLIGDDVATGRGLTNETSAADLATTMATIVRGDGLTGDAHALALDALRSQRIPVITSVLRPGVDHGSKSGEVDGIRHDVAFTGDRILAVLTSGYAEDEANAVIRDLARRLLPRDVVTD